MTRGKFAIVDDADADIAGAYNWNATPRYGTDHFYAQRSFAEGTISLHLEIAKRIGIVGSDLQVDHENRDGLDCRRSNLRAATHRQNGLNRGPQKNNDSGLKGVYCDRSRQARAQWRASIMLDNRQHNLGWYLTPVDAALAYDAAARRHFGEFAYLNFPAAEVAAA